MHVQHFQTHWRLVLTEVSAAAATGASGRDLDLYRLWKIQCPTFVLTLTCCPTFVLTLSRIIACSLAINWGSLMLSHHIIMLFKDQEIHKHHTKELYLMTSSSSYCRWVLQLTVTAPFLMNVTGCISWLISPVLPGICLQGAWSRNVVELLWSSRHTLLFVAVDAGVTAQNDSQQGRSES